MIYYGRECDLYGDEKADLYIFCFFHDTRLLSQSLEGSFYLICPHIEDWNSELSPWKTEGFEGKGSILEKWIISVIQPGHHYAVAGYSLGGLFSLWVYGRHVELIGCVSCSGSLWYPGWLEELHRIHRKGIIYLSLGTKESHTKNRRMVCVAQNTEETYCYLSQIGQCIYRKENGGHFHEPVQRMTRGLQWFLKNYLSFFEKI